MLPIVTHRDLELYQTDIVTTFFIYDEVKQDNFVKILDGM